jgi:hypothetical protein
VAAQHSTAQRTAFPCHSRSTHTAKLGSGRLHTCVGEQHRGKPLCQAVQHSGPHTVFSRHAAHKQGAHPVRLQPVSQACRHAGQWGNWVGPGGAAAAQRLRLRLLQCPSLLDAEAVESPVCLRRSATALPFSLPVLLARAMS